MKPFSALIALTCLAAALPAISVSAENSPLTDLPFADLLQTRIESATKRSDEVRDIPASVTIVTREEIERYGYTTFDELLKNLPGLFMIEAPGSRGLGSRGPAGGGVLLLVNGVEQYQIILPKGALYNIPVESIDRIEVIRGPMSIIYGNNAFVGVINVVTNQIDRRGAQTSVSVGGNGTGRLFARAGKAFDEGFVALNAGGYRDDGFTGAYAEMMGPEQLAALDPAMHRSMAGDMGQRDRSLELSAGWGEWSADIRYVDRDFGFYVLSPPFDEGSQGDLASWLAALSWEHRFAENLALRFAGVHSDETLDGSFDFLAPVVDGLQLQDARRTDLELNLFYDPLPELNLLAGYRFRALSGGDNRVQVTPGILDLARWVDSASLHDLFTEIGWNPSEPLRLVGGLRYSRLPDAYGYTEMDYLTGTLTTHRAAPEERNSVTGRIAALWSLDPQRTVKLIWGTAAQDNYRAAFADPERIETTELNYLETHPGWSLAAGLFNNRVSQIVRSIREFDPATGEYVQVDDNSGVWRTRGVELEAEIHPLPELNLGFSAVWQQAEDQKMDIEPGYAPSLLLKLKADYRRGAFTYGAYAYHVREMEADWDFQDGPTTEIQRIGDAADGYWNLGLNLRYDHPGGGFYANLNAANLLDQEIRYPANEFADLSRGLIGVGRVVTATVGWKF
jgi:outer membrane receptor protein involved in Fe transport